MNLRKWMKDSIWGRCEGGVDGRFFYFWRNLHRRGNLRRGGYGEGELGTDVMYLRLCPVSIRFFLTMCFRSLYHYCSLILHVIGGHLMRTCPMHGSWFTMFVLIHPFRCFGGCSVSGLMINRHHMHFGHLPSLSWVSFGPAAQGPSGLSSRHTLCKACTSYRPFPFNCF